MNDPYECEVRWFVVEYPGGSQGVPQLFQYHNGQWYPVKTQTLKVGEDNEDR